MSIQRTCLNCQKTYTSKRPNQKIKFCCRKCYTEYCINNKPKHVCKQCQKEFIPKSYKSIDFCSSSCAVKFNNAERAKNGFTMANCYKIINCCSCGDQITVKASCSNTKTKCKQCKQLSETIQYCKVCGSTKGQCQHPEICKKYQLIPTLIKLGLDETSIGSPRFYEEYFKIKDQLTKEYLVDKMSFFDLTKKYSIISFKTVFNILKTFNIKARTSSEAANNALLQGKMDDVNSTPYPFKSGYHISWFGQEFYWRSTYELEYAKQLDETKTMYQMESLKIPYFDSVKNKNRIAIPDFYLPETNTIVEIKSSYTLELSGGIQNMVDKFKAYKELGYDPILQLDHKELITDW